MGKECEFGDLELSVRAQNCLQQMGISNVSTLLKTTAGSLRHFRGFGEKTIKEIRERLAFHGLCLEGDILVQSASGIAMVHEIPKLLDNISVQSDDLMSKLKDINILIDRIIVMESNKIRDSRKIPNFM